MTARSTSREAVMLGGLALLILGVFLWLGPPTTIQVLVSCLTYGLIALGLNVQWGYGGQFNFAIMGFLMLGGYAVVLASYPINPAFWNSEGPALLGRALLAVIIGIGLVLAAARSDRVGIRGKARTALIVLAWGVAYVGFRSQIDPATTLIEAKAGFVGGLGLPVLVAWLVGGALAAVVAWFVGHVCLGLRTDYLAIATIGIAEIIRALLKNMDWLTRGTMTVSPLPWPVLTPGETGIADTTLALSVSRGMFLAVTLLVIAAIYVLLQRAYYGPWGRLMRAIRDNHVAAESIGKDVKARQVELFVLGSVLIGIAGAIVTTYVQIYNPGGYQPINHTFIVWAALIVGGAGNNLGALFGGVLLTLVWNISEPLSLTLFGGINRIAEALGLGAIPDVASRASQMRVFFLGLVIVLALRFAPRGLLPEWIAGHRGRENE